jgi:hypothetical protein
VVNKLSISILSIILLSACGKKTLSPQAYMAWINDTNNGLIKSETFGKVKYTIAYRPSDYNKAKALIENDSLSLKNSQIMHHSFILKMEPVDGTTQVLTIDAAEKQEPFQRINYYLSEAQQYFQLIEGKDTLPSNNYIYERYYNLSPTQNMVVGFDQKHPLGSNELTFILEDKIFNTGKIAYNFSSTTLQNIPILKTE